MNEIEAKQLAERIAKRFIVPLFEGILWLASHFAAAFGAAVGCYLLFLKHGLHQSFSQISDQVMAGYVIGFVLLGAAKLLWREAQGASKTQYLNLGMFLVALVTLWFTVK